MKHILIICKKGNEKKGINGELNAEGYTVEKIAINSLDRVKQSFDAYDLAIIHLHPDVAEAWRLYVDFKERYPDLPVMVYMDHQPLTSLKAAIRDIFRKKPRRLTFSPRNDAKRQDRRL